MSDSSSNSRPFRAGPALGFGLAVLRRRPITFAQLSILQAAIFTIPALASFYVMGVMGQDIVNSIDNPVALMQAQMRMSLITTGINLLIYAGAVWIEAIWLELFLNDRVKIFPPISRMLWLLLSFVIIFAIFFAGYIVIFMVFMIAAIIAGTSSGVAAGVITGLIGLVVLLVVSLVVMSRFSALPAMTYLEKELRLGKAWALARANQGSLMLAWLGFGGLYLIFMAVYLVVLFFGAQTFAEAIIYQFENFDNPYAQYEVYAGLVENPTGLIALGAVFLIAGLIYSVISAVSRGIGVSLALSQRKEETA